jgi:hypothetical protein
LAEKLPDPIALPLLPSPSAGRGEFQMILRGEIHMITDKIRHSAQGR